ncbi:hypothetical protein V6N12_018356 [Hibiscus sabdariffa]|uniref:Pleckstrin-like plant domain-containing protein n=1 Tax=Hibiscus sabdariffa TaxID=183260 RepID=A0ABR2BQT9_9ROSI
MTLITAGAATSLRGVAALRARLQKVTTFALGEGKDEGSNELHIATALNFFATVGELFNHTRKGDLHWKQVSFYINSNRQVVIKLKSKHKAGTYTEKKKCPILGVHNDIPAWPKREREDNSEHIAYFGIETGDRIIEFESNGDKQMWHSIFLRETNLMHGKLGFSFLQSNHV